MLSKKRQRAPSSDSSPEDVEENVKRKRRAFPLNKPSTMALIVQASEGIEGKVERLETTEARPLASPDVRAAQQARAYAEGIPLNDVIATVDRARVIPADGTSRNLQQLAAATLDNESARAADNARAAFSVSNREHTLLTQQERACASGACGFEEIHKRVENGKALALKHAKAIADETGCTDVDETMLAELIKRVEKDDEWYNTMRGDFKFDIHDGARVALMIARDLGTPNSVPFINETLRPYSVTDEYALQCGNGNACKMCGLGPIGFPLNARPRRPAPWRAFISAEKMAAWRRDDIMPRGELFCFPCLLDYWAREFTRFAVMNVSPPGLLHSMHFVVDNGTNGFPAHAVYPISFDGRFTGFAAPVPMQSMIKFVPDPEAKRRGITDKYCISVADFRSPSATTRMD